MGKSLVLAEKPSVGRELARTLGCARGGEGFMEGPKWIVTWALGHLVTLADPEAYDVKYGKWNMEDLPMLPDKLKTVVIKQSAKQFGVVRSLMKRTDIDEVIIATDSGREGELVARWIMEKAGWKGPARRLWISSQTEKAIREGFASLRDAKQYDPLYKSALARAEADWLVGLNVSRALTCRFNASLSAGRVQTPTLAMLVRREEEIAHFVPKEYRTVRAAFDGFSAVRQDVKGNIRISDPAAAEETAAKLRGKSARVTQVKRTFKQTPPPAAYDLTELQRDANKHYAYTAKETLSIMQSLYETHKVLTYPRTDSRYITADVAATIPERLAALAGTEAGPLALSLRRGKLNTRFIVNDAKVTDHHAIIPTEETPDFMRMTGPERNIYMLVVRRFLAVLMPPREYEEVTLELRCEGETLRAHGTTELEKGWRAAYGDIGAADDGEEDADDGTQLLPRLAQGDVLPVRSVTVTAGKTKPPARYTDATLLTAMEHPESAASDKKILEATGGLGTPATRAEIIEKLLSSFCVERHGKELIPTAKGKQLVEIVPEELTRAELTAAWETRLARIAEGKENDREFVREMRVYASRLVEAVKTCDKTYRHDNQTRERCPDCGKFLLAVTDKKGGKMLVCPDRECGYRKHTTIATNARCPNCHKKMELRGEGDKKTFVCVCGFRQKLSDMDKRSGGAGKSDVRRYLQNQETGGGSTALAEQLKKWQESSK